MAKPQMDTDERKEAQEARADVGGVAASTGG
jgi:hypothetical protein